MAGALPQVVTLSREAETGAAYDNHPIAELNDHVVRISVMTSPYPWHHHPNSDETFLSVEGGLRIEFEAGAIDLSPGQMLTVPRGQRHRTSPIGARSVNLTFEKAASETTLEDDQP